MKQKTLLTLIIIFLIGIALIVLGVVYQSSISLDGSKNQTSHINASFNNNFQIKINQTAIMGSENISITFLNVTEDSRCPEGVVCVWPGQVKVLFCINIDENLETFNLTLNSNETQSQRNINGYLVKLVNVDPYPVHDKKTENYVATLYITPP